MCLMLRQQLRSIALLETKQQRSSIKHSSSLLLLNPLYTSNHLEARRSLAHRPILNAYEQKLESNAIRQDPHQYRIVESLQALDDRLRHYRPTGPTFWNRILNRDAPADKPRGLYLWGSVGCGKTFLMDLFHQHCSLEEAHKKRVHFHRFMLDVHADIHLIKKGKMNLSKSQQKNPIPAVAKLIASRSWLLCLDEFQVTDVVDAMILKQLFEHLFRRGVILLATSNRVPDDLYKSGLQRSAFLPFIPLLKANCKVKCLDSHIDYRRISNEVKKVYFVRDESTEKNLDSLFKVISLAENDVVGPKVLMINNRPVRLNKTCGRIADCHFSELCEQPLGADDYDRMGKIFHTVIVRDIPQLTIKRKSEVRRFITFIDLMYDNRVRVVFSAQVPIYRLFNFSDFDTSSMSTNSENEIGMDDLNIEADEWKKLSFVTGEDEIFAFDRTLSRMMEMQTNQYWDSIKAD